MKTSKLKPLFFGAVGVILTSCAQTPPTPAKITEFNEPKPLPETAVVAPSRPTAKSMLSQARALSGTTQQRQLLAAAKQALEEQDYRLALAISASLQASEMPEIRQANTLVLLRSAYYAPDLDLVAQLLNDMPLMQVPLADRPAFLWYSARYHQQQQRSYPATRAYLQLDELLTQRRSTEFAAADYREHLWQQLSALNNAELASLKVAASNNSMGWINLLEIIRSYLGNPNQLQQALAGWEQRYPQLPRLRELPKNLQQQLALTPYQPRRIAVVLPFNGPFRQHARAVQYGLLAAATASEIQTRELFFFDSQLPLAELQLQLAAAQIDFVVGPLLREQVDAVQQLTDWRYPTLFLNSRDSQLSGQPDRFYFALNMEDEANQMAALFASKNYQRPVVISARNNISQRMTQQFSRQWQQLGFSAPESYQFEARDELEALVTRLLETDSARERIRVINGLVSGKIETEPHSRRDIDAIYLIADPIQTRMFKPFIDVSLSQHAPRLPVYASSRSFTVNGDANDLRDLNGLTFTETPWLLGEAHIQSVREQYLQFFPEQDEALQRLFAMGYDAYQLIGSLRQQRQIPAMSFPGLTGRLTVLQDGTISRQLSWARYQSNRLVAVQEP